MLKIPKSALGFKKKRIGGDALFEPRAFDPSLRLWNLIASWVKQGNKSLALEWGTDYDIRVNGIAKEHEPLFKLGEKWDIAMAAVYLASKSLSM
ncbi:hypothetical protein AAG906_035374 [Vitis piasezkii]